MAKRNISYFESRPDIVKLFDDLEKLQDFCRFEMLPFNEADLYNKASPVWQQYHYATRPRRPRGEYNNRNGGEYNRSGSNYSRSGAARNFSR